MIRLGGGTCEHPVKKVIFYSAPKIVFCKPLSFNRGKRLFLYFHIPTA